MSEQSTPVPVPPSPEGTGTRSTDAPQTGDIVIDSALSELAGVDAADLDGQLAAGHALHRTLQARLSDLGS